MASFDPNVAPTSDPNWLGWSKSIERPQSNTSMARLGETIGSNLESGVKGLDTLAGKYAEEKGYQRGTEEMDAAIANVDSMKDSLTGRNTANAAGPGEPDQLPDEVQAGIDYGKKLIDGRGDGKLSKTYTDASMMVAQKDLRSQFPTYRDQVDRGFAKATGRTHTANDYYNATLNDINSLLTKKDHDKEQVLTHLYGSIGEEGVPAMIKGIQNGTKSTEEGVDLLGKVQRFYADVKKSNEVIANTKASSEEKTRMAVEDFTGLAGKYVQGHLNAAIEGPMDMKSDQDIMNTLIGMQNGSIPMNAQQAQQLSQTLLSHKVVLANALYGMANAQRKDPKTGESIPTWSQHMGDKTSSTIDGALKQYDIAAQWIKDGDVGPLAATSKWIQAVQSDTKATILASKLGIELSLFNGIKELSGGSELMSEIAKNRLASGLSDKINGLVEGMTARGILTTEELRKLPTQPTKTTMAEDFQSLQPISREPLTYKSFVDHTTNLMFGNLDDRHKAELVKYLYDPKNIGILQTWNREGQPNIFGTLASNEMSTEIKRLDKTHPGVWDMYKTWGTQSFQAMAQKDVLDLNQFQRLQGENLTYDDVNHKFTYWRDKGPPNPFIVRSLANINKGLSHVAEIAKTDGSDPNAYIFNVMKMYGYDVENAPKSFATDLVNSIRATTAEKEAKRQKTIELLKKKKTE